MGDTTDHYAMLNVSDDAPKEVIDAAYKALCKKYHPDLNRNNPDAAKRMALINASYDVLSDYGKRYLYDRDRSAQKAAEAKAREPRPQQASPPPQPQYHQPQPQPKKPASGPTPFRPFFSRRKSKEALFPAFLRPIIIVGLLYWTFVPHGFLASKFPTVFSARAQYARPLIAPNGAYWPKQAGYIPGYEVGNAKGFSTVMIENATRDTDAFIKLYTTQNGREKLVRAFYIPHQESFALYDIDAGQYTLQYKDLDNGMQYKTGVFTLEDKATKDGTKGTSLKMTLNKPGDAISVDRF